MPRKTIAGLEDQIGQLNELVDNQKQYIDELQEMCRTEKASHQETVAAIRADTNVYLSYQPSGDSEVDAMLVASRALDSLPDPAARVRCARWVIDRVTAEAGGQF